MKRKSGILMPVFSLPSEYGIGGFGKECYDFIDYLVEAGQSLWQVLPLVQTGYGNSPYSSVSSESFSPYYISPLKLLEKGLATEEEISFSLNADKYVDYGFLYSVRYPLLRRAFARFDKNSDGFKECLAQKTYYDYALFMAIKYASGQKSFCDWERGLKFRENDSVARLGEDYADEIMFWQFVQYEAESEWREVKEYAHKNGIKIIGDMPLYVAFDSVDVWKAPELYMLDENLMPKKVAGVPPDYFQSEGQLWGNPVYDYEKHSENGFSWWINRLKRALSVFDYVRIDHFRGFDRFYCVEPSAPDARNGEWVKVPSEALFSAVRKKIKKDAVIAEDLGIIDDGVRELLKFTGYPGMKILSFAFNGESCNPYLPELIEKNSVCYTGTHDNDTLKGLIGSFSDWDYNNFVNGVRKSAEILFDEKKDTDTREGLIECVKELGFACAADTFILPFQDVLSKGSDYRINEPGTVKPQNWAVRFDKSDFTKESATSLKNLALKYERI